MNNVKVEEIEKGFTIVEVIVTMVIVSLFLFSFLQAYLLLESQRVSLARQSNASDIAYSNLAQVTSRTGLVDADCNMDGIDLSNKGYNLYEGIDEELGVDATQTLYAYPTVGCTDTEFADNPIQIVSKVTFYANGREMESTHASFVQ